MSGTRPTTTERLAQADLLLWIARGLAPPVDAPPAEWVLDERELAELARGSGLAARAGTALLQRVAASVRATTVERRRGEHARLFEAGQVCPPNETAYVRRDKGAIIADIAGFYRAFGFTIAPGPGEKNDHVVAELQFAALLLVLAAGAQGRGESGNEQVTARALASVAEDHLDAWLEAFCERLGATTELPVYAGLADLLRRSWELVVESNALPHAAAVADAAIRPDGGTPYECGMCEATSTPAGARDS